MNRLDEAKAAWTLWNYLSDFQDLLWSIYESQFLEFLIHDEPDGLDSLPPLKLPGYP
jgi:hypothetical protein